MEQGPNSVSPTGWRKWFAFSCLFVSGSLIGFSVQPDGLNWYLTSTGGVLLGVCLFLSRSTGSETEVNFSSSHSYQNQSEPALLGLSEKLEKSESILTVLSGVSKLWDSNIEVSRKKTEDSIRELGEKFSLIYSNIDFMLTEKLNQDGSNPNQQMFSSVEQSKERLGEIRNIFHVMQEGRQQLVKMVQGLGQHIDELHGMTNEVSSIAAQTNLLALNAAIEAARAGESGRGFAVVADAVRTLSNRSSETGKRMSESVELINSSISNLIKVSDGSIKSDEALIDSSDLKIKDILQKLQVSSESLVSSSELIKSQSVGIRNEVSGVIVSLQFQDRVSQILNHVKENINELAGVADSYLRDPASQRMIELDSWLRKMESRYATQEQRNIHGGAKPVEDNNQEITFF